MTFNSTFRYLDDLLNIDNTCFDDMVDQIYLSESKVIRYQGPFLRFTFVYFKWFCFVENL